MKTLVLLISVLFIELSFAKRFSTEFVEFELPTGWKCSLEGTEWLCQSDNKDRQREAIIIMAAKEKGPQDSLEAYTAYLKEKKTYTLPNRKQQVSEPKYTKLKVVKDTKWVDSLHLASEVPGFYTRYLATVKGDLGIAVTFSVGKDFFSAYQPVFDKVIESMRAFAVINSQNIAKFKLKKKDKDLFDQDLPVADIMTGPRVVQNADKGKKRSGGSNDLLLYGLLALGVGGFIAFRKAQEKKKKTASGKKKIKKKKS